MNPRSRQAIQQLTGRELARRRLKAGYTITQQHVQLAAHRPVRVQEMAVRDEVLAHDHDYYEVVLVRGGGALHLTDGEDYPLRPGTIAIIPPGKVHAMRQCRNLSVTNIYYLAEWLLADLRTLWETDGLIPLFLASSLFRRDEELKVPQFDLNDSELRTCVRELSDTAAELRRPAPSITFVRASFLKFLILLCRSYVRQSTGTMTGVGASPKESSRAQAFDAPTPRMQRQFGFQFRREIWCALEHIEDCIADTQALKVAQLAQQSRLSSDHLGKLFRQATGWSPQEYYQRRRIHQACQLLLNPRQRITDIGYALGYSDTAHLSRMFRRFMGLSPRQYRKMYISAAEPCDGRGNR